MLCVVTSNIHAQNGINYKKEQSNMRHQMAAAPATCSSVWLGTRWRHTPYTYNINLLLYKISAREIFVLKIPRMDLHIEL